MTYPEIMRLLSLPLNWRAHCGCGIMQALGYRFCVDFGYMNAEAMVEEKGLKEDLDLLSCHNFRTVPVQMQKE